MEYYRVRCSLNWSKGWDRTSDVGMNKSQTVLELKCSVNGLTFHELIHSNFLFVLLFCEFSSFECCQGIENKNIVSYGLWTLYQHSLKFFSFKCCDACCMYVWPEMVETMKAWKPVKLLVKIFILQRSGLRSMTKREPNQSMMIEKENNSFQSIDWEITLGSSNLVKFPQQKKGIWERNRKRRWFICFNYFTFFFTSSFDSMETFSSLNDQLDFYL